MYCLCYNSEMHGTGENVIYVSYIHCNISHDSGGDTFTAFAIIQKCMVLGSM